MKQMFFWNSIVTASRSAEEAVARVGCWADQGGKREVNDLDLSTIMTVGIISWVYTYVKLIKLYTSVEEFFYLLHAVWQTLGPSSSLQMTQFCSFSDWVISCCIHEPHILYPFIGRWTFSFLPCPGYCEQCCSEHWDACIFLNCGFSGHMPSSGVLS